jgi:hypothetical protein
MLQADQAAHEALLPDAAVQFASIEYTTTLE